MRELNDSRNFRTISNLLNQKFNINNLSLVAYLMSKKNKLLQKIVDSATLSSVKPISYNQFDISKKIIPETFSIFHTYSISPRFVRMQPSSSLVKLLASFFIKVFAFYLWRAVYIRMAESSANETISSEKGTKSSGKNKNNKKEGHSSKTQAQYAKNKHKFSDQDKKIDFSKKTRKDIGSSNPNGDDPDHNPKDSTYFVFFYYIFLICTLILLIWRILAYLDAIEIELQKIPYFIRPLVRFSLYYFSPNRRKLHKILPVYQKILDELTNSIYAKTPIWYVSPTGEISKHIEILGPSIKIGDLIRMQSNSPLVRQTIERLSLKHLDLINAFFAKIIQKIKDNEKNA